MRPAIASTPLDGDVQKAPVIHKAALCCIFFNFVRFLTVGAPLKNHSWNSYSTIGRMHVLYSRCFWVGEMPLDELSSIFIAFNIKRYLVA